MGSLENKPSPLKGIYLQAIKSMLSISNQQTEMVAVGMYVEVLYGHLEAYSRGGGGGGNSSTHFGFCSINRSSGYFFELTPTKLQQPMFVGTDDL